MLPTCHQSPAQIPAPAPAASQAQAHALAKAQTQAQTQAQAQAQAKRMRKHKHNAQTAPRAAAPQSPQRQAHGAPRPPSSRAQAQHGQGRRQEHPPRPRPRAHPYRAANRLPRAQNTDEGDIAPDHQKSNWGAIRKLEQRRCAARLRGKNYGRPRAEASREVGTVSQNRGWRNGNTQLDACRARPSPCDTVWHNVIEEDITQHRVITHEMV